MCSVSILNLRLGLNLQSSPDFDLFMIFLKTCIISFTGCVKKMTFTIICFYLIIFKSSKSYHSSYRRIKSFMFHNIFLRSAKDNVLCQNLYGIWAGISKVYLWNVQKDTCLRMSQKFRRQVACRSKIAIFTSLAVFKDWCYISYF